MHMQEANWKMNAHVNVNSLENHVRMHMLLGTLNEDTRARRKLIEERFGAAELLQCFLIFFSSIVSIKTHMITHPFIDVRTHVLKLN